MKIKLVLIFLFIIILKSFSVESDSWERVYEFGLYNNNDLRNSSTNMISLQRGLIDVFEYSISSKLNPTLSGISNALFTFSTTYLSMLWSHEFGHSLRANQVGGKFNFHDFGIPIPYTTVDLPQDISLVNEAIFVTAGFEVNSLNVRKIQSEFIKQNGIWNQDLAMSFANRLMYVIYTNFILPIDPSDRNVWIETAGDPVHFILPVFENLSNEDVFLSDGSVNTELVNFYNEARIFGIAFQLLDPQFYRELGAAFGSAKTIRKPIYLLGDYRTGWTYGTLFNASPLGYELYMQNYININSNQFGLYIKYGRPFKNIGLGISVSDIQLNKNIHSDILIEVWDQVLYDYGFSLELLTKWKIFNNWGFNLSLGYKTEGYLLGKQLNEGINIGATFSIFK